jgi:uncharacterized damage-inducible protein DinB
MPNKDYALLMARYNLWQNESLTRAASDISSAERQVERGAFFGTIEKTFSHILWGDSIWLSRFEGTDPPKGGIPDSTSLVQNWDNFKTDRAAVDQRILKWAQNVPPEWFEGDLSWYSGAVGRNVTKPKATLVVHMFNHQTHHRGQIHAMLTAAGAKPDATDIAFMPERFLQM